MYTPYKRRRYAEVERGAEGNGERKSSNALDFGRQKCSLMRM
jgi:hypothetical protein